jgi:ferric-dicitrate binding protein FerR (iron transport regulator)
MADEDPVATLIRLAGTRTSASDERTERVRARAHDEWTQVVRARTRRTRVVTASAALALAAMVLLVVQLSTGRGARPAARVPIVATLTAATGSVVFDGQPFENEPRDLSVGGVVRASRVVRTGPGVFAALTLTNGAALRIDEGSRVRIASPRDVELIAGRVYVETNPLSAVAVAKAEGTDAGESLQVHTAFGDVRDVGTRFEVRVGDGRLRVRVRDGEVIVNAGQNSARAGRGMEISTGARGLETRPIPSYGSNWAWVTKTAPPFTLAGRTLAEFLDWVSRETGYTVTLEGKAAVAASTTVLQGSIDGLTPGEALDVVLPSTGLEHRVVNGQVIVRAR